MYIYLSIYLTNYLSIWLRVRIYIYIIYILCVCVCVCMCMCVYTTHFTCFTSTKEQILTPEEQQLKLQDARRGHAHLCQLHQFLLSCDLMSPAWKHASPGTQVLTYACRC